MVRVVQHDKLLSQLMSWYRMVMLCECCCVDVLASLDKRMMIRTLKQFLRSYVGVPADNFDVSG